MGFNSDPNAGGLFTFTAYGTKPIPFSYLPAYCGDEGLVLPFAEGSGQSFAHGDPVKLSSGKVVALAYTVNVADASQKIVGFAMRSATGTADSRIDVRVIRPDDVWMANFDSDDTFTAADTGVEYGLKRTGTASGVTVVDQDTTSATSTYVTVLASNEFDGPGAGLQSTSLTASPLNSSASLNATAGGRLFVKFRESVIEFSTTE